MLLFLPVVSAFPDTTGFDGRTTNFSIINPENVEKLILEKTDIGRVEWLNSGLNVSNVNFTENVKFLGSNRVFINTSNLPPELNSPVIVYFYNSTFDSVTPLKNGELCDPNCETKSVITYDAIFIENLDHTTEQYSDTGVLLNSIPNTGGSYGAIKVDNFGNVLNPKFANFSSTTASVFRYTPSGTVLQQIVTGLTTIVALDEDIDGNVYVGSLAEDRIEAYDSDGNFLWSTQFTEDVKSLKADNFGNLYAATTGAIHKINSSTGSIIWSNTSHSNPVDLTVDSQGYVYVAHSSSNGVQKLNKTNGQVIWTYPSSASSISYSPKENAVVVTSGNLLKLDIETGSIIKIGSVSQSFVSTSENKKTHGITAETLRQFDENLNEEWSVTRTGINPYIGRIDTRSKQIAVKFDTPGTLEIAKPINYCIPPSEPQYKDLTNSTIIVNSTIPVGAISSCITADNWQNVEIKCANGAGFENQTQTTLNVVISNSQTTNPGNLIINSCYFKDVASVTKFTNIDRVELKNNVILSHFGKTLNCDSCNTIKLNNNTINQYNSDIEITIQNANKTEIHNNFFDGVNSYDTTLSKAFLDIVSNNTSVYDNVFKNYQTTDTSFKSWTALKISKSENTLIERNNFTNVLTAIQLTIYEPHKVSSINNNIIKGAYEDAITISRPTPDNKTQITFTNNYIEINKTNPTSLFGFLWKSPVLMFSISDAHVENNTLISTIPSDSVGISIIDFVTLFANRQTTLKKNTFKNLTVGALVIGSDTTNITDSTHNGADFNTQPLNNITFIGSTGSGSYIIATTNTVNVDNSLFYDYPHLAIELINVGNFNVSNSNFNNFSNIVLAISNSTGDFKNNFFTDISKTEVDLYKTAFAPMKLDGVEYNVFGFSWGAPPIIIDRNETIITAATGTDSWDLVLLNDTVFGLVTAYLKNFQANNCAEFESTTGSDCKVFIKDALVGQGVGQNYSTTNLQSALNSSFTYSSQATSNMYLRHDRDFGTILSDGTSTFTFDATNSVTGGYATLILPWLPQHVADFNQKSFYGDDYLIKTRSNSLEISNANGKVVINSATYRIDQNPSARILINPKHVAINGVQLPGIDLPATVTLNNVSCSNFELFYDSAFDSDINDVFQFGVKVADNTNIGGSCSVPSICSNVQCSNDTLTFDTSGFSSYAVTQTAPNIPTLSSIVFQPSKPAVEDNIIAISTYSNPSGLPANISAVWELIRGNTTTVIQIDQFNNVSAGSQVKPILNSGLFSFGDIVKVTMSGEANGTLTNVVTRSVEILTQKSVGTQSYSLIGIVFGLVIALFISIAVIWGRQHPIVALFCTNAAMWVAYIAMNSLIQVGTAEAWSEGILDTFNIGVEAFMWVNVVITTYIIVWFLRKTMIWLGELANG